MLSPVRINSSNVSDRSKIRDADGVRVTVTSHRSESSRLEMVDLVVPILKSGQEDEPLVSVISPNGTTVNVFNACVEGMCNCSYEIEGCKVQLRPCRFASIICNEVCSWSINRLSLLFCITDGFPIVDEEVPSYSCENYNSILEPAAKQQMDCIIRRELEEGMISEVKYTPHCIHSLGAVPKPGGKIRPITDCSRPQGKSVNNHCASLLREFKFKSVDDVVAMLSPGDYMTVIDIKSAYRAVPIYGKHKKYMGFRWEMDGKNRSFVDNRLSFGLRLGPCYFEELSEFIHDYLFETYQMRIVNYLDDFIAIAPSYEQCILEQSRIIGLLRFLGFHVSYEKVKPPSQCTTYLGIEIDSNSMELRLPAEKLAKLYKLLSKYMSMEKVTKLDLESLCGLLAHCSHVVRGGKIFCKRLYNLYKTLLHKNKKSIRIPSEARSDIKWWRSFCKVFNGIAKINNVLYEYPMVSDSSFKGYAVYLGVDWVAGCWDEKDSYSLDTECNHLIFDNPNAIRDTDPNINVLELWPIVIGLKRWAVQLKNKSVFVFTDNTQVLHMLTNGKSSNRICMSWIREIFWICIIYNIELILKYVNTNCNLVADTLSRLPYFKNGDEIARKIGGSDLCCIELLFGNYRSLGE